MGRKTKKFTGFLRKLAKLNPATELGVEAVAMIAEAVDSNEDEVREALMADPADYPAHDAEDAITALKDGKHVVRSSHPGALHIEDGRLIMTNSDWPDDLEYSLTADDLQAEDWIII